MLATKATPPRGQISGARVVPYQPETAKRFGGGARGRTLAIIYRQLCYWSKYAKWKGKNGKKFFYKSQRELADELGYSEKTINRAIKALRELGLVVVLVLLVLMVLVQQQQKENAANNKNRPGARTFYGVAPPQPNQVPLMLLLPLVEQFIQQQQQQQRQSRQEVAVVSVKMSVSNKENTNHL